MFQSVGIKLQVKNETHALWSWHRNQDSYKTVGDIIYIVRQPEICLLEQKVHTYRHGKQEDI